MLILANKQDLDGALSLEEIASVLGLNHYQFQNRHWKIIACSAMTGEGLLEGIHWLLQDIAQRIFL